MSIAYLTLIGVSFVLGALGQGSLYFTLHSFPVWLLFCQHLLSILFLQACLILYKHLYGRHSEIAALFGFSLILIVFMPFWGFCGSLLLLGTIHVLKKNHKHGVFEDYEQYILEKTVDDSGGDSIRNMLQEIKGQISFEPLVDVIQGDDEIKKIRLITRLSHYEGEAAVSILKQAVTDDSAEVRLHSASALIKIEALLNEKIEKARIKADREQTDTVYAHLGDLYFQYVQYGLLEKSLAAHYLSLAIECYQFSLDQNTGSVDVLSQYVKALVLSKNHERANKILEYALKLYPDNTQLRLFAAEVAFMRRAFLDTVSHMKHLSINEINLEQKEAWQYWTAKA